VVVLTGAVALGLAAGHKSSREVPSRSASFGKAFPISPLPNFSLTEHSPEKIDRVFYPYSVIPGGVRSSDELQRALKYDQTAATHYRGFNALRAQVIQLDQARDFYVSYRVGDRIYWTKRTMRLGKGEQVITDGDHFARVRCGNRLSAAPEEPTSAQEPAPESMEAGDGPLLIAQNSLPVELPILAQPDAEFVGAKPEIGPIGSLTFPPTGFIPFVTVPGNPIIPSGPGVPPIFPHVPHTIGGPPPTPLTPGPPPVVTPEPSPLILLLTGVGALGLLRFRRTARSN
jgi:hypothetical protein